MVDSDEQGQHVFRPIGTTGKVCYHQYPGGLFCGHLAEHAVHQFANPHVDVAAREASCCGNCAHFSTDNGGECRIMPPSAFVVMQPPDPATMALDARAWPRIIGGFPPVARDQWCAAHSDPDQR